MLNGWIDGEITGATPLEQLVHQSRLVGAEETLVLWGGGNNSIKEDVPDPTGALLPAMYVKGSGSDMKSIAAGQFPAIRLDYVLPLRQREAMSDQEMVGYLERCLLDPRSARPSIETLLHAFLPDRAVLHTHADAILAITNNPGREETVRACFGAEVITVPYLRPGFALSRLVAEARETSPAARGLVLMNHGLLTWGTTPKEAYERHIELVTAAEAFVAGRRTPRRALELSMPGDAARVAPVLRGVLSAARKVVLSLDQSPETMAFLERRDLPDLTSGGAATPDHMLHTRRRPLLVQLREHDDTRESISAALAHYRDASLRAFERFAAPGDAPLGHDPRVILLPGIGMFTAGKDVQQATVIRDIYRHSIMIMTGAAALGGYRSLNDADAFAGEYWPLELYKLSLLPGERELARHVVLVTGAAGGIGEAIAFRFAREGAHVAVTDLDLKGATAVAVAICAAEGPGRAIPLVLDVTDAESVAEAFGKTILRWGGIDIVVSNAGIGVIGAIETLDPGDWTRSLEVNATGHFRVVRKALEMFRLQGTGGSIVFNASKNVTAPGKDFGAYSVSKAAEAQLCRIVAIEGAEIGVRANMVNPDAIFDSGFWDGGIAAQRAAAYGISREELPEFYRKRNLLRLPVTAADVAEAALFLGGPRSGKTTGAMLPVDGGVREAFPR